MDRPERDPDQRTIPPDLIEQVRRLEIRTRRMVDELFGGEYHSVFKGQGMEFREVREYAPGDDVRSIDWNVTARMGTPYIKKYEEERELTVMLVADLSASQGFGTTTRRKSDAMAELGALLVFSAISNQDKVGLILFTDQVELYVPPKKGRSHGLRVVRELLYHPPRGRGTDLNEALTTLNRVQKRKTVAFVLSDFLTEGYERTLNVAARRHDLIAVQFRDRHERELPDVGLLRLRDPETGEIGLRDTSDPRVREAFAARMAADDLELERRLRRARADLIRVDARESVVEPLQRFFLRRERRR